MKLLLIACSCFVCANAVSTRQRASPLPARLVLGKRTPSDTKLEVLEVALVSRDFPGLQRVLEERADPRSQRYAQWLSTDEVTDFVAASDEAIHKVTTWMQKAGLEPELNNHRDYLTARNVPAAKVELLLGAALFQYYDSTTGAVVHRIPGNYSIPDDVAEHVAKVFPIHSVPVTSSRIKARSLSKGQNSMPVTDAKWPHDCRGVKKVGAITPAVTRALYNYTTSGGTTNSSIAAMLPGPVGVSLKDLAYTQMACGVPDHPLDKYVGKNDPSCSGLRPSEDKCIEAAMDSQIIGTTAVGCRTEFWNGGEDSFISMFKAINDAGDSAPRVFSFSFGDPETDRDDDALNTDKEFAKSVAKGITLVCSSGDNGAGYAKGNYVTNFPASSQYVLSVGSTSLTKRGSLTGGESAVNEGYSAGGYSSMFTAPSWQAKFTKKYLASGARQPKTGFTKAGRGVPDISSLGGDQDGWEIRFKGRFEEEGGTSTSGPFIASLVAKLNSARLSKGRGTMGHIGPWLYTTAASKEDAFYDVTIGSNSADGQSAGGVWYATKSWDPVTGLGTPNYRLLEQLALEDVSLIV